MTVTIIMGGYDPMISRHQPPEPPAPAGRESDGLVADGGGLPRAAGWCGSALGGTKSVGEIAGFPNHGLRMGK